MTTAREVLGLMLRTNADAVASVLRGTDGDAYSPVAALAATRSLALVVEDTMRVLVAQARSEGTTWQEIGDVLGTTRQAAQQRFGASITTEGAGMTVALPDAAQRAETLFDRYAAEDWSLRDDFDETMTERLSEEMLAAGWRQVTAAVGAFIDRGEPEVRVMQGHTVVDVPMTFERGAMKGRVAYDGAGRVAGLFVLNPDVV